jgi:4-hydroxy-tetrahydrodipicolinate reductase
MAEAESAAGHRLRVVQWATGYVGAHTLKKVIEHPDLELVGLYVFSESKAGKDAGELVGLPSTGIKATRDIDAIIALKPDCVLYMQEGVDYDDVCRLLEAGINIVTTRAEFHYGAKLDPAIRNQVEAACRKGNSSIHATGSSPGFITEALPIVLTSIQQRVDAIEINEYANMVDGCSPFMLFETMGYGKPRRPSMKTGSAWSTTASGSRCCCSATHSASRSTRSPPRPRPPARRNRSRSRAKAAGRSSPARSRQSA